MSNRRDIQSKHEDFVIEQFVNWLNSTNRSNYKIIEKPDPPDAVISDGINTAWIEHSDLYRNSEEATSLMTYLSKGEKHKPHNMGEPVVETDKKLVICS